MPKRRREVRFSSAAERAANRDRNMRRAQAAGRVLVQVGNFTVEERAKIDQHLSNRKDEDEYEDEKLSQAQKAPISLTAVEGRRLEAAIRRHVKRTHDDDDEGLRKAVVSVQRKCSKTSNDDDEDEDDPEGCDLSDSELDPDYSVLSAIVAKGESTIEEHAAQVSQLGASQLDAYDRAVSRREHLFITGGAGKGKSYVLRTIIEGLRQSGRTVAVLAPTGVAAYGIRGMTLHSFLHLPPAWYNRKISAVLAALKKKPEKLVRFQIIDTIVIDEISMVSGKLFNWAARIVLMANEMNKSASAGDGPMTIFGGKQLIVCGDFHQLPPVAEAEPETEAKGEAEAKDAKQRGMGVQFCFETIEWGRLFPPNRCVELQENFRQRDPLFIELLNRARVGDLTDEDLRTLRSVWQRTRRRLLQLPVAVDFSVRDEFRVRLYGLCSKVEAHNKECERNLRASGAESRCYNRTKQLKAWSTKQKAHIQQLRDWFLAKRSKLKKEQRLYHQEHLNQFTVSQEEASARLDDEVPVPSRIELCIGSRVMLLKNWKTAEGLVHGRCGWVTSFGDLGPIVLFDGGQTFSSSSVAGVEVPPQPWTAICETGRLVVSQVPLGLAWAMTIHKSQGMSIASADMDLGHLFESGQGYVGLSRMTSLEGLGLLDADPEKIYANPRVLAFYAENFGSTQHAKHLSQAALAKSLLITRTEAATATDTATATVPTMSTPMSTTSTVGSSPRRSSQLDSYSILPRPVLGPVSPMPPLPSPAVRSIAPLSLPPTGRSRFATDQIRQELEQNPQLHWGALVLAAWAKQAEVARQNPLYKPQNDPGTLWHLPKT